MILLRFIVTVIICFVTSVCAQNTCTTPEGKDGICVPAKKCSIIVNILTNVPKPLPQKVLDYFKRSHCGTQNNEHYACCSAEYVTDPVLIERTLASSTSTEAPISEIINVDDHPNLNLLPISQCGRIENFRVISNGEAAAIGQYPWMAMLFYQTDSGLKFQCGGALISSRYVLTAAHCVTEIDDILVSVRLGEYNTSSEIDCEDLRTQEYCADPVEDVGIEEVTVHPEYNNVLFANDIALIRLKREVDITSDTIQAVCLPVTEASQSQNLERVIISGWGLTEKNQTSNVLITAVLPIISNTQCQNVFRRSVRIRNSQICAGGENMIDSCKGDSGGPLIFPGKILSQRYVQYGIISAGSKVCGSSKNYPGIYAKVSFYIKWILDHLKP